MASPAWSRASLALLLWLVAACGRSIPGVEVAPGDAVLKNVNGVLHYHGAPFSGYVVARSGDRVLSRTPFWRGREEGRALGFYPDGRRAYERLYHDGYREGTHRGWWDNGQLQFVYHYERDLFEGEQLAFFPSGARFEVLHYQKGREEGRQSTWNAEGRLVSNYTFRQGRRYGIIGRFDCVSVHEQ